MRQTSPGRARTLRSRRAITRRQHAPVVCERCHAEPAVDNHELTRRSQADTAADVFQMVPLGRACHDWVGANPTQAVEEGWAMWGWQYRQLPAAEQVPAVLQRDTLPHMPRVPLNVRISQAADTWITKTGAKCGVNRTNTVKVMLAVASDHQAEVEKRLRALAAADRIS